jgi:hypothetical protein
MGARQTIGNFVTGFGNLLSGVKSPINQPLNNAKRIGNFFSPQILDRLKTDITSWQEAMRQMEQPVLPFRYKTQQIFKNTVLNSQVDTCMQKRKNLNLSKEFHICDENGITNEEATKLINTQWFRNGLNYILDAPAFGYTLIGFGDVVDGQLPNLEVVRRENVSPDRLVLANIYSSPYGVEFMNPADVDVNGVSWFDFSLYVPTASDLGVSRCGYGYLYKVAQYEILLRALLSWNATFVELYGQPIRWGKTNKDAGSERDKLEKALDDMGSNAWILTDLEDDLQLLNASGSGTGWQSYDNLEQRCNKAISAIILGHKDAIDSTPGKLGSGVSDLDKALDKIESSDARFAEYVVNDLWIPKLIKLGIKIPIGLRFEFKNDLEKDLLREKEDKNNLAVATIAKTMNEAGLKMGAEYFTERTGIDAEEVEIVPPPTFPSKIQNKLKTTYGNVSKKR